MKIESFRLDKLQPDKQCQKMLDSPNHHFLDTISHGHTDEQLFMLLLYKNTWLGYETETTIDSVYFHISMMIKK